MNGERFRSENYIRPNNYDLKTNEYKCELTFSFFWYLLLCGGCSGRRKRAGSTRSLPTGRRTTRLALRPFVIGLAHDIFATGAPLKETASSQLIHT